MSNSIPRRAGHNSVPRRAGHNSVLRRAGHNSVPRRAGHNSVPRMAGHNSIPRRAGHNSVPRRAGHNSVPRRVGHNSVPRRAGHNSVPRRAGHNSIPRRAVANACTRAQLRSPPSTPTLGYYSDERIQEAPNRHAPHEDEEISMERNKCLKKLFRNDEDRKQVSFEYANFSSKSRNFDSFDSIEDIWRLDPKSWKVKSTSKRILRYETLLEMRGKTLIVPKLFKWQHCLLMNQK
ncbi:hypothetical protein Lal_00026680 [Lupinus albus]|nr:hypothetical protein Lal_00026680 [Lupinus albus]